MLNRVRTKVDRNAANELLWFGNNAFVNTRVDTLPYLELMQQRMIKMVFSRINR